jgi:hypothetical protein
VAQAFLLSLLGLGAGCGENVLVGNWQLSRLSDAGFGSVDDVDGDVDGDADAGTNPQGAAAQDARDEAKKKHDKSH